MKTLKVFCLYLWQSTRKTSKWSNRWFFVLQALEMASLEIQTFFYYILSFSFASPHIKHGRNVLPPLKNEQQWQPNIYRSITNHVNNTACLNIREEIWELQLVFHADRSLLLCCLVMGNILHFSSIYQPPPLFYSPFHCS